MREMTMLPDAHLLAAARSIMRRAGKVSRPEIARLGVAPLPAAQQMPPRTTWPCSQCGDVVAINARTGRLVAHKRWGHWVGREVRCTDSGRRVIEVRS